MLIKTITVKQTVQIKQFCPLVVEAIAELEPSDNPDDCALQLRRKVETWVNAKLEKIEQTINEEKPF